MKILLSDGSLYKSPIEYTFELAKEAGFDGIELIWAGRNNISVENISRLIKCYDIPVEVIHEPFHFHKVEGWPEGEIKRLPYVIDVAEKLDARSIVVHGAVAPDHIIWQQENIPEYQKNTNILIGVENMPEYYSPFFDLFPSFNSFYWKRIGKLHKSMVGSLSRLLFMMTDCHYYNQNTAKKLCRYYNYITMDTTHLGTHGASLIDFFDTAKDKIAHIHLSDFFPDEHIFPGKGKLPLTDFYDHLRKEKYTGTLSLEVDPSAFIDYKNKSTTLGELRSFLKAIR